MTTFKVRMSQPPSGMQLVLDEALADIIGKTFGTVTFAQETEKAYIFRRPVPGETGYKISRSTTNNEPRIQMRNVKPHPDGFAVAETEAWVDDGRLYVTKLTGTQLRPPTSRSRRKPLPPPVEAPLPAEGELVLITVGGRSLEFCVPTRELFGLSLDWTKRGFLRDS